MLHDENYKRLFASPLMVEHLLRVCLPGDLLAAADFSRMRKLSTEYIGDELRKRHGDNVWRLRLGARWVYLLVLLEFQSEDDPWMALRIHTYTGLLYQELVRNEAVEVANLWGNLIDEDFPAIRVYWGDVLILTARGRARGVEVKFEQ